MLGDILRKIRKEKKLSLVELSRETKIDSSLLGQYEANRKNPSIKNLRIIADYFNVSVDYLLGRTDFINLKHNNDNIEVEVRKGHILTEEEIKVIKELSKKLTDENNQD